ncbi:MAG: phosphohistidine phosphatase SixA [Halobacteriovorax sp.]|nr:phosphohistidine phosphatase SixA [Halobacteriovorax sp.]|tara:strand:+ start:213311 stop:213748 length:438 start_codon:yes stop_codon:yes gene_type:complete
MKIYLVRHGQAVGPEIDPERPLTKQGIAEVVALAKQIKRKSFGIDEICHSGVLRAKQTAEILQKELGGNLPLSQVDDLLPGSEPKIWAEKLEQGNKNTMLVGHMPYMALLGELLIENESSLGFSTASMISFVYEEDGFKLDWKSQ